MRTTFSPLELPVSLKKYEELSRRIKKLHAEIWPDVIKTIKACNMSNYSIYYKDGYLFSYFEYVGHDYDKDMAKMGDDPITQKWWDVCKPCHIPLDTRAEGEWWANMEEVFHCD